MKSTFKVLCVLLTALPVTAFAWSNHSLGTVLALRDLPALKQAAAVQLEPLEDFLRSEAAGLQALLDQQEAFALANFPGYPERPAALRWQGESEGGQQTAFLKALRVSPEIKLANFVQALPGYPAEGRAHLNAQEVMLYKKLSVWDEWRFLAVAAGEPLSPLQVVASAADEPDYGHDINLFSDNPGDVGGQYNFGPQPFGDARFEYSSQAPFHIGYYHDDAIIFAAGPFLTRTYPEWRAYQYFGLARYAFEHGHPYWGYRFMGWGLHYIQDLTQPYHAKVLPGVETSSLIWTAAKDAAGFGDDKKAAIERVATRHTEIEKYQFKWLQQLLRDGENASPLLQAYADTSKDGNYPAFDSAYLRNQVSAQSFARADQLDALVGQALAAAPATEGFSQGNQLAAEAAPSAELSALLIELIGNFGAHSRNAVRGTLSPISAAPAAGETP
ncbi:MAG: phospholipase [Pseudomonas sp.]|uniref:phospholipase n=1 Tax=Pseudomonas sp. TaxID=306 RepID=UPI002735D6D1|nr:phospholipase [Pseudomonas sp.]MDP3848158.1 phospholipase [Pseudomonas sp.]